MIWITFCALWWLAVVGMAWGMFRGMEDYE